MEIHSREEGESQTEWFARLAALANARPARPEPVAGLPYKDPDDGPEAPRDWKDADLAAIFGEPGSEG
jgi:hypothetical protein